jgi:hypothetical protein
MRGVRPEWANLPKRRCRNCPNIFRPKKPDQVHCCANCRKEFYKHGGAFAKLRLLMLKEIKKRVRECNPAEESRIAAIEARLQKIEDTLEAFSRALQHT